MSTETLQLPAVTSPHDMDLSQEVLSIHNNSFSVNSSFEGADVHDLDDRQSYIELEHSVETATGDCSHDDVRQYHNMDRGSNIEENAESVAGMHEDVFPTQDDQESNPGSKSSKKRKQSVVETHPMQLPCACKRQCSAIIDGDRRKEIHAEFWSLGRELRSDFIFQRIEVYEKKRKRVRGTPKKERTHSRQYTFKTVSGESQQVCSKFFLGTLGYKKDTVITTLFNKQSPTKSKISATTFSPDLRGKHPPKHKMADDLRNKVIAHIESYHPSVSHYRRKHAPLRKYLPDYLTITEMYGHFCDKNPKDKANLHYESYLL